MNINVDLLRAKLPKLIFLKSLIILSTFPFVLLLEFKTSTIFWQTLAGVTGYVGLILFVWQVVLGSRFLISKFTNGILKITKLHKWLGIWATVLVISHPIFQMLAFFEGISWLFIPGFDTSREISITYGRVALWIFLIILLSSKLIRKNFSYRIWLRVHYLAYPMLFLALEHAFNIGILGDQYPALKALVGTLILGFNILIFFRLAFWAGFFKTKYIIVAKEIFDDQLLLTLETKLKALSTLPGQYIYLQNRALGEAHPFSILSNSQNGQSIQLLIKIQGHFTQVLATKNVGESVALDGPYGDFGQNLKSENSLVLIAGGVGISSLLEIGRTHSGNSVLIWCLRNPPNDTLEKPIQENFGTRYFKFVSSNNNHLQNSDINSILKTNNFDPKITKFLICGSKKFNKSVIEILKNLEIPESNILTEKYN